MAEPVFVVGSGRCGTKMIVKLLGGIPHIEARHEYVRDYYQRDAMLYHMGKMSREDAANRMVGLYASACAYSTAKYFLDASNKLTWVVDVLASEFPDAKFIHLVRDGRKVASSFYYKLHIMDDRSTRIQREWLENGERLMPPPPEKYWWPPAPASYDQFERCCFQWTEANRVILKALADVPHLRIRLEDLTQPDEMKRMLDYLDVPYNDSFVKAMERPEHVWIPLDFPLDEEQREQFERICGEMMKTLGYTGDEYRVRY